MITLSSRYIPFIALFIPVSLVVVQPDLGTAILIVAGGLVVVWLAGLRMKYFAYSHQLSAPMNGIIRSFLDLDTA